MTSRQDPPPVTIPPPPAVRIAGLLALTQAVGVLVLAALMIVRREDADLTWALATASYFLLLALLMAAVARGLLVGRRWARTPLLVTELLIALVGFYLTVPSAQVAYGLLVGGSGVIGVALLLSRQANEWIRSFPPLFGPEPDR